jgi:hypothetical protein
LADGTIAKHLDTGAAVIQYCKGTTGEPLPPPAGRRRLDRATHTPAPVPPRRTITPKGAAAMLQRIDEGRAVARHQPRPEVVELRQRLREPTPPMYREADIEAELDALLLLAGHASYTASTLLPYRKHALDLDRCAQQLAQHRAHFLARWQKARGAGQQPDAPLDRQRDPAADTAREVVHSD